MELGSVRDELPLQEAGTVGGCSIENRLTLVMGIDKAEAAGVEEES